MPSTPLRQVLASSSSQAPTKSSPPNQASKLFELMSNSPSATQRKRKSMEAMSRVDADTKSPFAFFQSANTATTEQEKENAQSSESHLQQSLNYSKKGRKAIKSAERAALQFINERYDVPNEVSMESTAFGPLSGTCYEERVLNTFADGKLSPYLKPEYRHAHSTDNDKEAINTLCTVCVTCGLPGHTYTTCQKVLLL